ncbi:hypothetical protein [Geodermatophilus maliterrae]|uniref:Serine-threonine protein kinase n=1 Tax=Geodermatophilus maliterrae TaxID=3162531 RepID=A0ABV3X8U9_9ACTN
MADIEGLPYWTVRFDADGDPDGRLRQELLTELPSRGVQDLFVFSHGWNNSPQVADLLYRRFFALVAAELGELSAPRPRVGVLGVVWPSMRWLDEAIPDFAAAESGGAASAAPAAEEDPVTALKAVFPAPAQQDALERMAHLLREQPEDTAALVEFQRLMAVLGGTDADAEDAGEAGLVQADPLDVSDGMARAVEAVPSAQSEGGAASVGLAGAALPDDEAGAAGLRDLVSRRWEGAKQALRQFTYFQMKRRAGVVGERGLGPLCTAVRAAAPGVRLHLVGHSFGARLVSFALKGLPGGPEPAIASLTMLQGAFSHFAFADRLPFRDEGGALAGHADRVAGPIVVVHSVHDTAVGALYPAASLASRDDAAGIEDLLYRWGAMGHDGAQAVDAASSTLEPGDRPVVADGARFLNVDAGAVVRHGPPPSGAHSDVFHRELARLVLSAARIGGPPGAAEPVRVEAGEA